MAGMNLNPYNLNTHEGPVNKKLYSNHYSGDKNYNNEEEKSVLNRVPM